MRKTIKIVVFTLLCFTIGVFIALWVYLHFFAADDRELAGEWTADLDMTTQAAVTAFSWLQDIEGVSVSLEEIEACMQDLTIQVRLTFDQTAHSKGTFHCSVVQESYDACRQDAYAAFAEVFHELLAKRLSMAGYTGSMDEDAMELLVTETFGMSTDDYLMSCAPALLPSLEDLQAQYAGSGTYEVTEDVLTRQFDGGGDAAEKVQYYIRKESTLILFAERSSVSDAVSPDEDSVIYTLQQSFN